MTTTATTRFEATNAAARTGFFALAVAVTFTLLAGVSQIANLQADEAALMAQADAPVVTPADQVVVIVGKRAAA